MEDNYRFDTIPYASSNMLKTRMKKKRNLPKEFNLLKKYKNNLYPIFRQYVCGSCWAWAVASIISDRYMIKFKTKNPLITPTSIMSGIYCMKKGSSNIDLYNGCEGGSAFDALVLLSEIVNSPREIQCENYDLRNIFKSYECDNYDWCELNPRCNTSLIEENGNEILDHFKKSENMNDIMPEFTEKCQKHIPTKDYSSTISTKYNKDSKNNIKDIKLSKAYVLEDIESIKYAIYTGGPVINNFVIFPDFIYKPKNQELYWVETDNIYIHKKNTKIYDMGEHNNDDNDLLLGYHSTSIIGWEYHKFNKKKLFEILKINYDDNNKEEYIEIPYWICRNIWGKEWNGSGYYKIAMTNFDLGINTEVGCDIPIELKVNECYMPCHLKCNKGNNSCMKTKFGGCCAIDILDLNEIDYREKTMYNMNSIKVSRLKNGILPSNFSKETYIMLDKNHTKKKKKKLFIILLIILLIIMYNQKYRECTYMIYIILTILCIILINKL